jgi:hypothetical protein
LRSARSFSQFREVEIHNGSASRRPTRCAEWSNSCCPSTTAIRRQGPNACTNQDAWACRYAVHVSRIVGHRVEDRNLKALRGWSTMRPMPSSAFSPRWTRGRRPAMCGGTGCCRPGILAIFHLQPASLQSEVAGGQTKRKDYLVPRRPMDCERFEPVEAHLIWGLTRVFAPPCEVGFAIVIH